MSDRKKFQVDAEKLDDLFGIGPSAEDSIPAEPEKKESDNPVDAIEEAGEVAETAIDSLGGDKMPAVVPPTPRGLTSIEDVHNELNDLIQVSKDMLQQGKYLMDVDPNSETIAAAATLVNSVRNVLNEFTTLYRDELKHQRAKEIEDYKTEKKKELMQYRKQLDANGDGDDTKTVEYSQEALIDALSRIPPASAATAPSVSGA